MNIAILTGRLTADPELKQANGKSCLSVSLAVNRPKNADGTRTTDFIECVFWGSKAEVVSKYCKRGHRLSVMGNIRTSTYQKQDGSKATRTSIVVNELHLIESSSRIQNAPTTETEPVQVQAVERRTEDPYATFGEEVVITDDMLPF